MSGFRGRCERMLPFFTANCHWTAVLRICIAFFDLAPSFDFQSLCLGTPSSSSRVIVLSVLIPHLKFVASLWACVTQSRSWRCIPGHRSFHVRTACLPGIQDPSRIGLFARQVWYLIHTACSRALPRAYRILRNRNRKAS
jgi:hypothetical protein